MTEETTPKRTEWRSSEERFRLLVESVKDYGIFTLDPKGYITSWNEGARRIKGYEAEEAIGLHFSRFYPPEDIAAGKPEWELEQALKDGRVEDEGWRLRKDGTRFWADVVITALIDPKTGELRGFGKVTRDLTERKNAEERLRQSEEQFRLLLERVDEYAIFMLDPAGRVATWNTGAQKIKGYTVEEIVGEHFERFYLEEDRLRGKPRFLLSEAMRLGHVRDEGLRVRKNGATFTADVLITALHDDRGELRGFAKVTRDVTDQIRNREAETARIAAEKANRAKDEFLAVLSHELRTPLTPVIAGAEYLAANALDLPREELKDLASGIQRNARLEAQLIDDLLDLTRISRGKIELKLEAVDVHVALGDAMEILRPEYASKGVAVTTQLEAAEHWMWADPTRLRQIFWNLLNNAVKFTPAGGKVAIHSHLDEGGSLVVEVSDDGIGIEREQIVRIFSAFEQGERTVTRQFGGLGLGLAITRSLVEMHHGTIVALSEGKGRGATFRVRFAALLSAPKQSPTARADAAARQLSILLVDDHEDTRQILSQMLARQGHTVEVAGSVATAISCLQNIRFDALLSDIGLPDASGYDLMRQAHQIQPKLKGIALSGFGMDEDVKRSKDAGFSYHITKPIDMATLRQRLHAVMQPDAPA